MGEGKCTKVAYSGTMQTEVRLQFDPGGIPFSLWEKVAEGWMKVI